VPFGGLSLITGLIAMLAGLGMLLLCILITISHPYAIIAWLPFIWLGYRVHDKWTDLKSGITKRGRCPRCNGPNFVRLGVVRHSGSRSRECPQRQASSLT